MLGEARSARNTGPLGAATYLGRVQPLVKGGTPFSLRHLDLRLDRRKTLHRTTVARLATFAPSSPAMDAYRRLWADVAARIWAEPGSTA